MTRVTELDAKKIPGETKVINMARIIEGNQFRFIS